MDIEKQATKVRTIVYVCPVDHNGTSVFVKGWIAPNDRSEGIPVILVHDLDESPDDYVSCAEKLAEVGFNIYIFELRIQTKRMRGSSMLSMNNYANDLLQVVSWIKHKESGRRPIVIGQGFGALVGLSFAQKFTKYVSAMVFAAPLFSIHEQVSPFKRFCIRTFAQVMPFVKCPNRMSITFSEHSGREAKKKRVRLSLYFTQELLVSISRSHKLFSRMSLPTLLLCPEVDPVCHYDFLKRLISRHTNEENISLVTLDWEGHQILTRGGEALDSVLGILIPWLKVHGNKKE